MNRYKRALQLFLVSASGWVLTTQAAWAQVNTSFDFVLGDTSPIDIIIAIINWTLGILALIAVVIILYGGFVWMTAQGDEEKLTKAKAILRNALIGLVIILASWGIARYIINLFLDLTGATNDEYSTPYEPYESSSGSPFYVDHSNPADGDEDVTLCHIIAVTFSYPLNESSVDSSSFTVTIPEDSVTNPGGGLGNSVSCTSDNQCLSGVCSDAGSCDGDAVAGSFAFSESSYAAVFYPSTDYLSDTTYRVELSTAVEGISPDTGAVYNLTSGDAKRIFTFTTGNTTDDIPPKVDVTDVTPSPDDDEADICLNPTFQVSFSESLDPASPADTNVWLYAAASTPTDSLDLGTIRLTSIGGEADDTIATSPELELSSYTDYGLSLYSGDSTTDTFEGAIYDTCGNPLSGDFDDDMEGSPTDDFVDPASSGLDQAFCSCTTGTDSCNVDIGSSSCDVDADTTCTLDATCSDTSDDYVGFTYQWNFTTGDEPYCLPNVEDITQEDYYYSEDEDPTGDTGSEDTGIVLIEGEYLYPFYDVDFNNNMSAAGMNCFDTDFTSSMSCFVDNIGSTAITVRTPVASQTGRISVENADGADTSADTAIILSPYVRNTSPLSGPPGQYVTIRGSNFIDYDPDDTTSERGHVYFDGVEVEVMCDDGWDDDQIIVRVPDEYVDGDTPLIQVLTVGPDESADTSDDKYSNHEGFTVTSGNPGPGICELDPSCSDSGLDDVAVIGENFGTSGTAYLDPPDADYEAWPASQWDVYNSTYDSQSVVTDGASSPFTAPNDYTLTLGNSEGISNGLDFDITCHDSPQVFQYYQCDLEQDTYYLPNPTGYTDNACVNSVIYFGFTNDMDDATVEANATIYQCNSTATPYDATTCTTSVAGTYVTDYLNAAYLGGDSSDTLDGTDDIDGDGDINEYDAYSGYTFYPDGGLDAAYYYLVTLPVTITNKAGVPLGSEYSWYFAVRDDTANCVADYLALNPAAQRVNSYDSFDACLDQYEYNDTSYSLRARPATSDCLILNDAGDYDWSVTQPVGADILSFGVNDATTTDIAYGTTTTTTTNGYNTVCLEGDDETNDGLATVSAELLDSSDGSVAASDDATIEVDFGFCTQDSDCYTEDCRDTYCDATTSHCAPDIIAFTPNNSTGSDVGPSGCVTLSGCYFGNDQDQEGSCTCTQLEVNDSDTSDNETCSVDEGGYNCLLQDGIQTCSLDADYCALGETCSTESTSANYDLGFFRGCDCTMTDGTDRTCRVEEGYTECVAQGDTETCDSTDSSFVDGGTGSVSFTDAAATDYPASFPSEVICEDIWDNDQVIAQVPGSVAAGDYSLTLNSYYSLTDIYGSAGDDATESDCTVGSNATPCLCRADPDTGRESTTTDLYGEGFDLLTTDGNQEVTFSPSTSRLPADGSEIWTSANFIDEVVVPEGAVSDDEGVQLENDTLALTSNALSFSVSCGSNLDCATGCCSAGQCATAETCNACENSTDCTYGSCLSECADGMCEPYIIDVSPEAGAVGQPVTIQGCHFGTYYNPSTYTTGSKVTVDGITAELACSEVDSWNNLQIIATMPDDIFVDTSDTTADVVVTQVYTSGGAQVAQTSNTAVFSQDESCSEVDLPVLCDATPGYSPLTTSYDVTLEGEQFADEDSGYCTCNTTSLGDCEIAEGSASCTVSATTTYYVNPDFTSETCATTTSNAYSVYDGTLGYCVYTDPDGATTVYLDPEDPTEVCATTTTSADTNGYSTYSATDGYCTYTDPTDATQTCVIAVGNASCSVCTIPVDSSTCSLTASETCYVDEDATSTTCSSSVSNFTNLDGSAEYFNDVTASVDWTQYYDTQYITDVPDGSETGDVLVIATTDAGTQCSSNGLEFPVTCDSCSECGSTRDNLLNCNLDYDPSFGSCTADTAGFCRDEPDSCCNLSSCAYDDSDGTDTGTCAAQPIIQFDDEDADALSDYIESDYSMDAGLQDTDDDDTIDSDEVGVDNGNYALDVIDSATFPTPGQNPVCSNAQISIQFSQPITTSAVFDFNDNDTVLDENGDDITDFTDDVAPEDIEFTDYIRLHYSSFADTSTVTNISDIVLSNDGTTLTFELSRVLRHGVEFEIIIETDDYRSGIIDAETGVPLGCTTEMEDDGLCYDGYLRYTFTTTSLTQYSDSCSPAYVVLEADSEDFQDANYTFSESEQEESFTATVYAAGEDLYPDNGTTDADADGVDDGDDDQPITRIDDGADAGFDWTYAWDPIYDTIEDLEAASCPVAGIITDEEVGSCSCDVEESCDITAGDETCTTSSGVSCYTDSPNAECDAFDSGYDPTDNNCVCTVSDSCTIEAAEASCTVDINDTTVTCTTDSTATTPVCDTSDTGWSDGSFVEDTDTQTLTADTPDSNGSNTDTIEVRVTGDGSVEQGWGSSVPAAEGDDLTDSILFDLYYCDANYLVSYSNADYNFYWRYCRGTDPQDEDFLPDFSTPVFERSDTDIDTAYGSDQEFIYEVAFKDATAGSNDPTTNNNLVAVRVYPNDFDGDLTTPGDSVNPDLWYLLNTNNADASSSATTIDGYDAVEVGNTTYVAATNLDDGTGIVSPYIYVIAYSSDADEETTAVVAALLEGFKFNRNDELSASCAIEKVALIADADRVTDLGTIAYVLSSYYYNDTDLNGTDDFPALASGSYISGFTTSIWPSWNDTFGTLLGQTLDTDPVNAFADAETSCPYDPPDLSAGETTGTYYDETGTCWDPVLEDFYGPADSELYLYQYHDADDFALYTNLEYDGTGSWIEAKYDPCTSYYDDGTTATTADAISAYSDSGCGTFDYIVEDSETTDNTTYDDLF
ncbi:MAG: Ig-like domain-containing protein [Candidatus Kerfeldbacteria bacterium]|nr:Ig-like domain-containing protein [Candidatus Kerfeldbacteria bacterium]